MKRLMCMLLLASAAAYGQAGEISLSLGASRLRNNSLGSVAATAGSIDLKAETNFRLALRLTLNNSGHFGHEFGYAYNRGKLRYMTTPTQDVGMPVHQGFYNFLLYATKEGSHVRPFAAAGGHFSTFYPPGASVYSGNGVTKFGVNYGGGVKVKLTSIFGLRLDLRDYITGKPFDLPGQKGMLKQLEASAGLALMF